MDQREQDQFVEAIAEAEKLIARTEAFIQRAKSGCQPSQVSSPLGNPRGR